MKKRIISRVLALSAVFCMLTGTTITASAAVTMKPSANTSMIFGNHLNALILKSGGELWGYIATNEFEGQVAIADSKMLLGNVAAVSGSCQLGSANLLSLALQTDGTLYACQLDPYARTFTTEPVAAGVAAISDNCYLTENGELYGYGKGMDFSQPDAYITGLVTMQKRVAENVISFAGTVDIPSGETNSLAYITADHVLHYGNGKTMSGFSRVFRSAQGGGTYFALADNGDLYGWGNNDWGQAGNGGKYNSVKTPVFVGSPSETGYTDIYVTVSDPEKILSQVQDVYFDDCGVYAKDASGALWQWGDSPVRATVPLQNGLYYSATDVIMPDAMYCSPRRSDAAAPVYRQVNQISVGADGTVSVDAGNILNLMHIALPVSWNEIMK